MNPNKTLRIIVSGRVQGVGFRYFVQEKAREYNICGWVRNNPNRTVEIEVEGHPNQLEVFIDFIKLGNGHSRVDDMRISEIEPTREFLGFQVRY